MSSMTPDLLPGEHWCRSCQRPESEVPMYKDSRFTCVQCAAAARALYYYWKRKRPKVGPPIAQAQARTQVREVAAA